MTDDYDALRDWYMHATEEEIAAEDRRINAELAETERRFRRMPVRVQIAYHRKRALDDIMENRRRLLDPQLNTIPLVTQMWRDGIMRNQVRLLRLRAWRATGVEPGRG